MIYFRLILFISLALFLSNCKSTKICENSYNSTDYKGSVHVGDPYKIRNKTYTPKLDYQYDEIGIASWYGHRFHCQKTANGESFNKHQLSAAHTTLPLPSVVRVTNLSNNKSVEVIVNDRGPFTGNRIIDLSEKAAIAIGMKNQGIAKVRVQFLPNETNELMNKIASKKKIYYGDKPSIGEFAILVDSYKNQKTALETIKKVAKYGEVHLIHYQNFYTVLIISKTKAQAELMVRKLNRFGYKKAKLEKD